MAFAVRGRSAIVTGAGSGINLSFSALLLSRGCNVVFADIALRPEAKALIEKHSLPSAGGVGVFQHCDVTDWNDLQGAFKRAETEFGGVDIVCPGAGIFEPTFSNFWNPPGSKTAGDEMDAGRYKLLDINVTHPIRMTQLAIEHFRALDKNGSVVNVSSIAGQLPAFVTPMYAASKSAINGFVRSLGELEKRFGIRVTAVAPGIIKTPLWLENPEKMKMLSEADEWVTPDEVAKVMLDLVEKDECNGARIEGGAILEVSKNKVRNVEVFNDPGPSGAGNTVGNMKTSIDEVCDTLDSWKDSKR